MTNRKANKLSNRAKRLITKYGRSKRRSSWLYWSRGIKVVGAIGAIGTVAAVFLIWIQINSIQKQNKALWYSNRPALKIDPINKTRGITKIDGDRFRLLFDLVNVGRSPAVIRHLEFAFPFSDTLNIVRRSDLVKQLVQGGSFVENAEIRLDSAQDNYLCIKILYGWDNKQEELDEFELTKYYAFEITGNKWTAYVSYQKDYDSRITGISDTIVGVSIPIRD